MRRLLCLVALAGCATSGSTSKRAPVRAEAREALRDAARLYRLGPSQYSRAKERLSDAISADGKLWEAYYDRGRIELAERQNGAAAADFLRALDARPSHLPSLSGLVQAELGRGRPSEAARRLRDLLAAPPKDLSDAQKHEFQLYLAEALRQSGKSDAATDVLREILRADPHSVAALSALALVYDGRGQSDLADLVLHRALEIEKAEPALQAVVWNNLGMVALHRRRADEAFAHFDQASRLDPTLTVARRNKALTYLDCGDYGHAVEELKALAQKEEDADTFVALGVAERGAGDLDGAERAFHRALELQPHSADALYDLGIFEAEFRKRPAKAIPYFEQFLNFAPENHSKRAEAQAKLAELKKPPTS